MYIYLSSYIYIYVSVYLAWIRTSESMPSPLPPSGLAPCPLGVAVVPPLPPKRSCGSFHPRGSPKWMVYKGRLFKVSDFGLPPFTQTPMCRTYLRNPGLEIGNFNADLGSRGHSCLFCSETVCASVRRCWNACWWLSFRRNQTFHDVLWGLQVG